MITSAEEFVQLRTSVNPAHYVRAANEAAPVTVWYAIIQKYPEMKPWVIHNKTIPLEILDHLTNDADEHVRSDIARKRKIIGTPVFAKLAQDPNEQVRRALLMNTKLTLELIQQIKISDSKWLQEMYKKREQELE